MSINLTESSRDRDGERAGNNCLERRLERTIISPVVVPLLGHDSNPSSSCIAVRRATIFPFSGERRGVSRLCYVTRRHSSLPPPFPIIASLLPKIMYTLLYARSSFTARRIDESNDNIYFRVESGLLRSFSYTFSSSSYTLEKSFLRITKSAETLPTIDRSLFDSLVSSPLPSHRCYQIFSFLALRILYVETHTLKFIVIPAGKYIAVDLP